MASMEPAYEPSTSRWNGPCDQHRIQVNPAPRRQHHSRVQPPQLGIHHVEEEKPCGPPYSQGAQCEQFVGADLLTESDDNRKQHLPPIPCLRTPLEAWYW